jgi:hypothetical protein
VSTETSTPARGVDRGSVTLAYLHKDDVTHSWHDSLMGLLLFDAQRQGRLLRGGKLAMQPGADGLGQARSLAVAKFLREEHGEWLFFLDTDMGFAPDTLERLLQVADPVERPIVGGLCFAQVQAERDGLSGFRTVPRPTIFDWVATTAVAGFQGRSAYPVGGVVQCGGTGSACILIHRSVLEAIGEAEGPVWYSRVPNPTTGELISEDLSFCIRAGAAGVPIFVDTSVKTTHQKTLWLAEQDYWNWVVAPPAADLTAVIVPVMRRPQNAVPFMRSLRASTGMARVYAVADHSDPETGEAWEREGAFVLPFDDDGRGPGTFAEKVNCAAEFTGLLGGSGDVEPWLFITGDDVSFRPGWLDHAQAAGATGRAHVIGTNDLGNPRVMSGEHATHLLIRRDYVAEVGASWDGPGVVAHEGYRHNFVDDEIVTAAQRRGVWAMALGSKVEHLHPLWEKSEPDDVYALGVKSYGQDRDLFVRRSAPELAVDGAGE